MFRKSLNKHYNEIFKIMPDPVLLIAVSRGRSHKIAKYYNLMNLYFKIDSMLQITW